MGNIKCKCNNVIKFSEIPNPNEWLIISDVNYDKYTNQIDSEKLYTEMRSMMICNSCNRIWVYWDGFDNPPSSYSKEE